LCVVSGWLDDPRRPLDPGDTLYATAAGALENQDRWSRDFHRGFWTGTLAAWPRPRGAAPTRDRMAKLVDFAMMNYRLRAEEVAEIVGVATDSLRRERHAVHGAQLAADSASTQFDWENPGGPGDLRLPRVVTPEALDDFAQAQLLRWGDPAVCDLRPNPLAGAYDGVWRRSCELFAAGDLWWHGSLLVRYFDGEPDFEGAWEAYRGDLGRGADVPLDYVEERIRDAQDRGILPPNCPPPWRPDPPR